MSITAPRIPRDKADDYTADMARRRREFLREQTGTSLSHIGRFSFDPGVLPGNVENFSGVAQVPIGIAGPLRINGEEAQGDFYVPLATTEGTLVASYNRGMRLLSECGGVRTSVVDDQMQRAPVCGSSMSCQRGQPERSSRRRSRYPTAWPRADAGVRLGRPVR